MTVLYTGMLKRPETALTQYKVNVIDKNYRVEAGTRT